MSSPCDLTSYLGNATWYSLCDGTNGAGAAYGCPCDDDLYHVAYPNMPQTNCDHDCWTMPTHDYCDVIAYSYWCKLWVCTWIHITDCACFNLGGGGSCTETCGYASTDCASFTPPLIDLTRAAFKASGAPLSAGRIPIRLHA